MGRLLACHLADYSFVTFIFLKGRLRTRKRGAIAAVPNGATSD